MGELKPLFDILHGDSDPSSPRTLTYEAQISLAKVEQAINEQSIGYFPPDFPSSSLFSLLPFLPLVCGNLNSVLGPSAGFSF